MRKAVISRTCASMPAIKLSASGEWRSGALTKMFFPLRARERFRCRPLPLASGTGLGMKEANRPLRAATAFTAILKAVKSSAAARASLYRKSISFCPGPCSW